jgi:hypothetical protein
MALEKSLDHLSHVSQFADFLQSVSEEREACISALFNAPSEKMQQIAGQILAYDQILKMCNAEDILFRKRQSSQ